MPPECMTWDAEECLGPPRAPGKRRARAVLDSQWLPPDMLVLNLWQPGHHLRGTRAILLFAAGYRQAERNHMPYLVYQR
eukprot:3281460-Amphidinium_carterae.1